MTQEIAWIRRPGGGDFRAGNISHGWHACVFRQSTGKTVHRWIWWIQLRQGLVLATPEKDVLSGHRNCKAAQAECEQWIRILHLGWNTYVEQRIQAFNQEAVQVQAELTKQARGGK